MQTRPLSSQAMPTHVSNEQDETSIPASPQGDDTSEPAPTWRSDSAAKSDLRELDRQRQFELVDSPARVRDRIVSEAERLSRDLADTAMPRAASSSCSHRVTLDDAHQAAGVFGRAADALLDVNHWGDELGPASADFALFDARGERVVGRGAEEGDTIRIDLPGPAPMAWVRIESVSLESERVSFVVRPTFDPTERPQRPQVTQHFFDSNATNTFTLERRDNRVRLSVEGRNETPNVGAEVPGVLPPLVNRGTTMGAFGIRGAGFQHLQWDLLTEHILESAR